MSTTTFFSILCFSILSLRYQALYFFANFVFVCVLLFTMPTTAKSRMLINSDLLYDLGKQGDFAFHPPTSHIRVADRTGVQSVCGAFCNSRLTVDSVIYTAIRSLSEASAISTSKAAINAGNGDSGLFADPRLARPLLFQPMRLSARFQRNYWRHHYHTNLLSWILLPGAALEIAIVTPDHFSWPLPFLMQKPRRPVSAAVRLAKSLHSGAFQRAKNRWRGRRQMGAMTGTCAQSDG